MFQVIRQRVRWGEASLTVCRMWKVMMMVFHLKGFTMNHCLYRLRLLPNTLREALGLTLQLKRTFDEGRPISEALSSFVAKQAEEKI